MNQVNLYLSKYFINGLFAHAESTLIFDISEYTEKGFDTFKTYLGVDTYAKSNGNGVKFTIYGSVDGIDYTKLTETNTLKGISDAKEVVLSIKDYNYLKLFADDLNNNSSDHAVYASAMLYNSNTYTKNEEENVDYIKEVEEYDKELMQYSEKEILASDELELKLLQRTLVKRVGYDVLVAYATGSEEENKNAFIWLFTNKDILKTYMTGGEPLGNYINSFNILVSLYNKYGSD